jgi:hypothetical protein
LSNNARPFESIYLKLENRFGYDWLPSKANWSLEVFNGFTEGSLNGSKSMLLGIRAVLSPVEGLEFELVQTSQWGGKGHNTGISALGAALFFDTNANSNSNINKMAGFGISYLIPTIIYQCGFMAKQLVKMKLEIYHHALLIWQGLNGQIQKLNIQQL